MGAIEHRWALDQGARTPAIGRVLSSFLTLDASSAIDRHPSVASSVAFGHWARVLRLIADHSAIERSSRELCVWSFAAALVWERVVILRGGSTSTSLPFFLIYSQASRSTSSTRDITPSQQGWRCPRDL
jgi:hypothetical protein